MTGSAPHRRRARTAAIALGLLALIAGHVVALHAVSVRLALPVAVAAGVLAVVLIAHAGGFARLRARLRARKRS